MKYLNIILYASGFIIYIIALIAILIKYNKRKKIGVLLPFALVIGIAFLSIGIWFAIREMNLINYIIGNKVNTNKEQVTSKIKYVNNVNTSRKQKNTNKKYSTNITTNKGKKVSNKKYNNINASKQQKTNKKKYTRSEAYSLTKNRIKDMVDITGNEAYDNGQSSYPDTRIIDNEECYYYTCLFSESSRNKRGYVERQGYIGSQTLKTYNLDGSESNLVSN